MVVVAVKRDDREEKERQVYILYSLKKQKTKYKCELHVLACEHVRMVYFPFQILTKKFSPVLVFIASFSVVFNSFIIIYSFLPF